MIPEDDVRALSDGYMILLAHMLAHCNLTGSQQADWLTAQAGRKLDEVALNLIAEFSHNHRPVEATTGDMNT